MVQTAGLGVKPIIGLTVVKYNFAYSSKNVTGLTAQSSDVYPTIVDYEVPADATKQEDLLVAKANDLTKTDAKVNFIFSHALTQVNFSIKSKVNDGLTYEVTDISISEVGNKATYNYGTGWRSQLLLLLLILIQ